MDFDLIREVVIPAETKIVLLVMDGLGGLPHPKTRRTELETADIPHLDRLAEEGSCGLVQHVGVGITPGSGPGHLSLFGYDPLRYRIGRGALEAVGIDFDLGPRDGAARGNFCTGDAAGRRGHRRAAPASPTPGANPPPSGRACRPWRCGPRPRRPRRPPPWCGRFWSRPASGC